MSALGDSSLKLGKVICRRKSGLKFLPDAGFICDKATVTVGVPRKKIKDRLFMRNTDGMLYRQTEHCVAGSMISHYAAAVSSAMQRAGWL